MRSDGETPLVTTIITSYNHEAYVRDAIDSALRQRGPFRHEVLLSDDGSTDGTAAVMAEYAERFPHVVRNISSRANRGISANLRECFATARGEYVAILEGDDRWSDEAKLSTQIKFLLEHPSAPMVFSRSEICDSDGGGIRRARIQDGLPGLLRGRDVFNAGSSNVILNFSSCMFRRTVLIDLPEVLWVPRLSEIALFFHLEKFGPIGYIERPMSVYRQHVAGTFAGERAIGRLRQEIACRKIARSVCAPEYVADFDREIRSREDELSLRLECDGGMRHFGRVLALRFRSALKCYRENGFRYSLRRTFWGRRY